jgi:hypothetical protein
MFTIRLLKALLRAAAVAVCIVPLGSVLAAEGGQSKTADGLTAYLGVVPAEIVKGSQPHSGPQMHGRVPKGTHQYHVVVALFDAATGARISDAAVSAQISGIGLAGTSKNLDAMLIAGTTTYGAFFDLPGADLYTIRVTIERPSAQRAVVMSFRYDHRR